VVIRGTVGFLLAASLPAMHCAWLADRRCLDRVKACLWVQSASYIEAQLPIHVIGTVQAASKSITLKLHLKYPLGDCVAS